jgi:uncharacterized protein (TIGR03086 family)
VIRPESWGECLLSGPTAIKEKNMNKNIDSVACLQEVVDETTRLVNGVSASQLGTPTPCADWTVRDLINHITGGATMFALSAEHGVVPDEVLGKLMTGDNLGSDPKGAWATAAAQAMSAFALPGVLDRVVKLPFGEMPARVALNIAIFDVATHAADLAAATGSTIQNTEVLETALAMGREMIGPEMRAPGLFDAEQPAAADAPVVTRLLAFAGRRV